MPISMSDLNNYDRQQTPVPTPPTSYRTEDTSGSDHGTTVHVNIPSAGSVRDGIPQTAAEQAELASSKSERSASRTPLHAVSPAQSTRVPQAPATTPATHGQMSPMKLYRDQSGLSTGSHKKPTPTPSHQMGSRENTRSPNAEIRAPTNSPRALTPEQTGLGTIQETGHEEGEGPHPMSRGGRSVRFAEEVPEIPPPPSSPQNPEDTEDTTPVVEPQGENPSMPASRQTGFTNQPTFNTTEKELSQEDIQIKSAKKRDSLISTPEPWPQVNEADYDVTPAHTKLTLNDRTPHGVT
uniref:Mucin-1-like n=1 Tax=Crassostrea virginica TaxID=6565 RepID=A0A8B8CXQ5_CRAVI|nr:mucin-1-like [Crassostrea virginica]